MARFPIVRDLSNPKVTVESTIGEIRIDGEVSALLIAERKAGRPIILNIEFEERLDGIHIVAAELRPTPVPTAIPTTVATPAPAAEVVNTEATAETSTVPGGDPVLSPAGDNASV